jgi:hypothetical protein
MATIVATAIASAPASAEVRAEARSSLTVIDLLRLTTFEPTEEGLELSFRIEEDELGQLGLEALDAYLRANRPQLFSDLSLGLVRYRNTRIIPREVRVRARPNQDDILDVEVLADVVGDQQRRELVCEAAGWRSQCEQRWIDRGAHPIATVRASGDVHLSLREDRALARQPLLAEAFLRRIRGSMRLRGLAGMGLELDLDPPYRAEPIALGLPPGAMERLRVFGDLAITSFRVAAAPERRVEVRAAVSVHADD